MKPRIIEASLFMFHAQTNVVLVKEIMVFSNKPHNDLCLLVVQTGKKG